MQGSSFLSRLAVSKVEFLETNRPRSDPLRPSSCKTASFGFRVFSVSARRICGVTRMLSRMWVWENPDWRRRERTESGLWGCFTWERRVEVEWARARVSEKLQLLIRYLKMKGFGFDDELFSAVEEMEELEERAGLVIMDKKR